MISLFLLFGVVDALTDGRDMCQCVQYQTQSFAPYFDVGAELPDGVQIKSAGEKGLGVFAQKNFAKGDVIGSVAARPVACAPTQVRTPLGNRELDCQTHFFGVPSCQGVQGTQDGGLDYEKYGIFTSWMTFLNAPDDAANVAWGAGSCRTSPDENSLWTLVAMKDLSPGEELLLEYDEDESEEEEVTEDTMDEEGGQENAHPLLLVKSMKAMKAMKAARKAAPMKAMKATRKAAPKKAFGAKRMKAMKAAREAAPMKAMKATRKAAPKKAFGAKRMKAAKKLATATSFSGVAIVAVAVAGALLGASLTFIFKRRVQRADTVLLLG